METLVHGGVTYVKVTALAKKYKYTTDYIGQLCRAGKVDCQLVGRAWFVNEASLLAHKSDRYKQVSTPEVLTKLHVDSEDSLRTKVVVYPTVSKHVHKHFESRVLPGTTYQQKPRIKPSQPVYQTDDTTTILPLKLDAKVSMEQPAPSIKATSEFTTQHISVRNESKKPSKLSFSPLPEVSLRGSLKIENLDTEEKYENTELVTFADFSDELIIPKNPILAPLEQKSTTVKSSILPHSLPQNFSPQSVQRISAPTVPLSASSSAPLLSQLFLPLVLVGSIALVFFLLSFSTLVVSDGYVLQQTWQFNVSQVITALSFLFQTTP